MKIKFTNGKKLPIIMCIYNGKRNIKGVPRKCREILLDDSVISLDELKLLLTDPTNLSVIEVTGDDGEVEVLENYVYASEIKDNMDGTIIFTVGEKTALEIEKEEAMKAIDELLIAMEV